MRRSIDRIVSIFVALAALAILGRSMLVYYAINSGPSNFVPATPNSPCPPRTILDFTEQQMLIAAICLATLALSRLVWKRAGA